MAISVDGRIGVVNAGSSAPSTLADYLTSIGKDSLYGRFKAPDNLYSDISNTVPVTTDGASWRSWLPYQSAGGFSAYFTQATGTRRCALGLSRNGKPGVYGDGIDWYAALNSTTVLNLTHTVLISTWATFVTNGHIYSHSNNQMQFRAPMALANDPIVTVAAASGSAVSKVVEATPVGSTTASFRAGFVSSGTTFYNTAPNIFRNSGGTSFTDSTIYEIWLIGAALTPREISAALQYLA